MRAWGEIPAIRPRSTLSSHGRRRRETATLNTTRRGRRRGDSREGGTCIGRARRRTARNTRTRDRRRRAACASRYTAQMAAQAPLEKAWPPLEDAKRRMASQWRAGGQPRARVRSTLQQEQRLRGANLRSITDRLSNSHIEIDIIFIAERNNLLLCELCLMCSRESRRNVTLGAPQLSLLMANNYPATVDRTTLYRGKIRNNRSSSQRR